MSLFALIAVAILAFVADAAEARPRTSTKIQYYTVSGSTAAELHDQMFVPGFTLHGDRAYANISARPSHDGELIQGKTCRLKNYYVKVDYVITLPALAKGARVSSALRAKFNRFQAFTRRHEERHRALWTACARKAELRILKLRQRSCDALATRAYEILNQEWNRCEASQDAFDEAEQKQVSRQALVRSAIKEQRSASQRRAVRRSSPDRTTTRAVGWRN